MNLTKIIEETGRRIRAGKMPVEKLTNADVKEVLEAAVEVMKQALLEEGRIEIQDFLVLEVRSSKIAQPSYFSRKMVEGKREQVSLPAIRLHWTVRPTRSLREAVRELRRKV